MTDRTSFYIDDHALLYAYLVKSAVEAAGEEGQAASRSATGLYGLERGTRMALRCLRDGRPLTMKNYLLYGEWQDTRGWSQSSAAQLSPVYTTQVKRCGWRDTWVKYGLEAYGEQYCAIIDFKLVEGFSHVLSLEMPSCLSAGDACCTFCWKGAAFDRGEEQQSLMEEKSADMVKDFLYHTGHLLSVMSREYYVRLGAVSANTIISEALQSYEAVFGAQKRTMLLAEQNQNFLLI